MRILVTYLLFVALSLIPVWAGQSTSTPPTTPAELNLTLDEAIQLALILCSQYTRTLSKNLTCQFQNREYQIQTQGPGYALRKAAITVCVAFDGTITLLYKGRSLPYRILQQGEPPIPLADEKSVADVVTQARANQGRRSQWKPAPDHPWRRYPVTAGAHSR